MPDPIYELVATLEDEPGKEYVRRVWLCQATNIYVKTHTHSLSEKLGKLSWKITGSICNGAGVALRDEANEPLVRERAHHFSAVSENTGISAEERAQRLNDDYMAQHRYVVALVEAAALDRQARIAQGL